MSLTPNEKERITSILEVNDNYIDLTDEQIKKLMDLYGNLNVHFINFNNSFPYEHYKASSLYGASLFYKHFPDDYKRLESAYKNGRIITEYNPDRVNDSFYDLEYRNVYLFLSGSDRDAFNFVHECSHYLDFLNTNRKIPNLYDEVYPFFMEKLFENYAYLDGYEDLSMTGRNNRLHSLKMYALELKKYIKMKRIYDKLGIVVSDEETIKKFLSYKTDVVKEFLLRYLIADLYSFACRRNAILSDFVYNSKNLDFNKEVEARRKKLYK